MALKNTRHGYVAPTEAARPRFQLAGAGAAGTHANQNSRHHKAGKTARVSTRNAQLRAVLRHEYS
ncbi:MAG TPA: hypothetical protein VF885_12850 [Arthrobacter sp.]